MARLPRLVLWAAIGALALLLLYGLAWLAVPPIVKSQAEQRLSALLGREVGIGRVRFSPWSLELTVEQLRIGAGAGAANRESQLSIERVYVNADLRSLLHLAPVFEAIDIDAPKARLTRLADGRYDIDDVMARFKPDTPTPVNDEPTRFAIYNVRINGGSFDFDDQPVKRQHRLQGLQLALPFLSNLPDDVAVTVEPRLTFMLDGAAFDSGAQATPFAQNRASQLDLRIADLKLAPWLPYLPADLPLRPSRGVFSGQLQIQFAMPPGEAPRVTLKGQTTLRDVAFVSGAGAGDSFGEWRQLQVSLADVRPLARQVDLSNVTLDGARVDLRRNADGSLNFLPAAPATTVAKADGAAVAAASAASAATAASAASVASAAAPATVRRDDAWSVNVERITLSDAQVEWHDAGTQPAAALRAAALELSVQKLRWPFVAPAPLKLSGRIGPVGDAESAAFTAEGDASDGAAKLKIDFQPVDLRWLAPYVAQSLVPTLDGHVAVATTLDWAGGEQPRLTLSNLAVNAKDLRLTEGKDQQRSASAPARKKAATAAAAAAVRSFVVGDGSVDLLARRIALGSVTVERPALRVSRNRQGQWNLLGWARPATAVAPSDKAAAMPQWQVQLGEAKLVGGDLRFKDERPSDTAGGDAETVALAATGVTASVRGLTWPGAAMARTQLQLRLAGDGNAKGDGASGRIDWNGQLAAAPLQARGTLRVERAPLHLFEPYIGDSLNLDVLRAEATWRGEVAVAQRSDGIEVSARGDAMLGDLLVNERLTPNAQRVNAQGNELLSWQSFALRGLQFAMKPGSKPKLDIQEAALTDFYSRLVITEQGRLNLRDVAGAPASAASAAAPDDAASAAKPTTAAAAVAPAASAAASAPGSELPIEISVGGTQLINGKVDFRDRFIKPSYSAALTELNGHFGAFSSTSREMATLDIRGRAAGTALLEISGAVNPTAQPLALDIRAKASDLELAALSPYAGRYAGYAIERGKLSMEVAYKIDPDGKLDAKNQLILNQLTFGEKVESPDATKLPVLLAVALLKDRNGVIDLNLPISGSINDPQFSIFGVVLKIIGNLLAKALTAPFALLTGGGSDDLSFVGFEPGTASLTDSGRATIDKVAKALADRPALKMTVTGASDQAGEREAAQKAALEARVRAEQRRDVLRDGAASDTPLPALTAAQRAALIKRIYADTKLPDKPRNAIGLVKDIPVAEMETRLRNAAVFNTDTARELALQRGLAVRDALVAKGLPSERLFVAAPKLRTPGEGDQAWTPRVQLALGTN
jgi:hypothetical protein